MTIRCFSLRAWSGIRLLRIDWRNRRRRTCIHRHAASTWVHTEYVEMDDGTQRVNQLEATNFEKTPRRACAAGRKASKLSDYNPQRPTRSSERLSVGFCGIMTRTKFGSQWRAAEEVQRTNTFRCKEQETSLAAANAWVVSDSPMRMKASNAGVPAIEKAEKQKCKWPGQTRSCARNCVEQQPRQRVTLFGSFLDLEHVALHIQRTKLESDFVSLHTSCWTRTLSKLHKVRTQNRPRTTSPLPTMTSNESKESVDGSWNFVENEPKDSRIETQN